MSLASSGMPTLIADLVSKPRMELDRKSVRVVGRVEQYDAERNLAIVAEPSKNNSSGEQARIQVDTQLTEGLNCGVGSLVMVIGELEVELGRDDQLLGGDAPLIVLKARVSRCVNGLDYALYCKSLNYFCK